MSDITLITNATLVNEGEVYESDLLIQEGRIRRIDQEIGAPAGATIVDAKGRYLLPGVIDDQVHFREPGMTHKGNIHTESRAAVAGGVTSFMDMPNNNPAATNHEMLQKKHVIARENAAANWAFYFGATNDNLDQVQTLDPSTVCGLKIFMGASTGNMLVDDPEILAGHFQYSPVIIATHCESTPMIEERIAAAEAEYGADVPVTLHGEIRNRDACIASSRQAIALAKEHDAQLHVLHITTAEELDLFTPGPMAGKQITAETCIHFLHFSDAEYETLGNRIKCNPSIKTQADQDAISRAVLDGRIDILATDHAPHTAEEKAQTNYRKAPSGLPLVQDFLLGMLEMVHQGRLELTQVVEKAMHNPAIRFDVRERGFLREGYRADLVLVDMNSETPVTAQRVLSRCGWSPFEGRTFRSRVDSVWINGALAFDGQQVIEHGASLPLEFDR